MNHKHEPEKSAHSEMTGNLSELAHDVVTLAELQLKLMRLDVQESAGRMTWPIAAIVVAGVIAFGCVPPLLLALAYLLAESTSLSMAGGAFVAGCVGLLLAAGIAFVAWRQLRCCSVTLDRSRKELTQNVNWIIKAVSHPAELAASLRTRQESL